MLKARTYSHGRKKILRAAQAAGDSWAGQQKSVAKRGRPVLLTFSG
jgi:hypothetical protein